MKRILAVAAALLVVPALIAGQTTNNSDLKIFTGTGEAVTFEHLINRISESKIVFLGEYHDDSAGHAFQLEVWFSAF